MLSCKSIRNFRIDRIAKLAIADETLTESPERGLDAYLRAVGAGRIAES